MARCGCGSECNCVVIGGNCVSVVGSGKPSNPYMVDALVDTAVDNVLLCGADGLYVPPGTVTVGDTDCILMSGIGSAGDPVIADINPDLAPDNLIQCLPGGLYATLPAVEHAIMAPLGVAGLAYQIGITAPYSELAATIPYDFAVYDTLGITNIGTYSFTITTAAQEGLYVFHAYMYDNDTVNYPQAFAAYGTGDDRYQITLEILVNGSVATAQSCARTMEQYVRLNASIMARSVIGDVVTARLVMSTFAVASVVHPYIYDAVNLGTPLFEATRLGKAT